MKMEKAESPNSEDSLFGFPRFFAETKFLSETRLKFRIVLKELHENYPFCLVDRLHGDQLWGAATNRQFTDVEIVSRSPGHTCSQKCALCQNVRHGWEIGKIRDRQLRSFYIRAAAVLRVHGHSSGIGGQRGPFARRPEIRDRHSADCLWAGVGNVFPIGDWWQFTSHVTYDETSRMKMKTYCGRYQDECETAVFFL